MGATPDADVTRDIDLVFDWHKLCHACGERKRFNWLICDRSWTGDVPKMRLSIEKLDAVGGEPDYESDRAVREATREVLAEYDESN